MHPKTPYLDHPEIMAVKYFIIAATGAFIIRLIMAVIDGFHDKLECLSLTSRLGWKGWLGTNTLAYYRNHKLRP
jgi:hypothetical protein